MAGKLSLSVLLLLVVACPLTTSSQSIENAAIEKEEYAVYSEIISKHYIKAGVQLVVLTTPTCCEVPADIKDDVMVRFKEIERAAVLPSEQTLEDYVRRNRTNVSVRKSFKLNVKFQIVPYKRIEGLFDMVELEDDWKTFYRRYPRSNGYMRLSRVGFNQTLDEALLSTAWMSGSLSGEGGYVLLRKKDGRWNIATSVVTWVS